MLNSQPHRNHDPEERSELDALFERVSRYFGLLAEPMRIRILHAICDGERKVGEIVADVGGTQTNVSRHLAALYRAEVVYRRKAGNQVFYGIDDAALVALCREVCVRVAARFERGGRISSGLRQLARGFNEPAVGSADRLQQAALVEPQGLAGSSLEARSTV
jgi:DNA-binding transcriptional ArsR family regulator